MLRNSTYSVVGGVAVGVRVGAAVVSIVGSGGVGVGAVGGRVVIVGSGEVGVGGVAVGVRVGSGITGISSYTEMRLEPPQYAVWSPIQAILQSLSSSRTGLVNTCPHPERKSRQNCVSRANEKLLTAFNRKFKSRKLVTGGLA